MRTQNRMLSSSRIWVAVCALLALNCAPAQPDPAPNREATVVLKTLNGLVFVPEASMVQANGTPVKGVVTHVDLLNKRAFLTKMQSHLGRKLTLAGIDQITKEVVQFCSEEHRPLVNVVVPEQNVDSGTVQILVTEFHVGEVRTKGNRWFSDRSIASDIHLKHGDSIDTQSLLGEMDAANTNPFRRVSLVYEPSKQAGYTDLVLQTQDQLPFRFYSGFDNSGTPATGHDRWNFGALWGNVAGTGSQVSYQFSSSSDLFTHPSHPAGEPGGWSFEGHSLSWTTPFHWGDSLIISGDYERSVPNVGLGLGLLGVSGQASVRYLHNLPRTERFTQSLQAGYDFKSTNNNLDFGGISVSANQVEVDQFPLTYTAGLSDSWGATSVTTSLVYSPSGLTGNNNSLAFQPGMNQPGREFASARYMYFRTDANRLTRLPSGASYSLRVTAQASNSNLLYTEQVAGGGQDILRGYSPFSVLGDEGVLMSNELRSAVLRKRGELSEIGQIQLLTFWDYAALHSHQAATGYQNAIDATSAGVGIRYNLRKNVTAKMDYGWALRSIPGTQAGSSMAALSLTVGN